MQKAGCCYTNRLHQPVGVRFSGQRELKKKSCQLPPQNTVQRYFTKSPDRRMSGGRPRSRISRTNTRRKNYAEHTRYAEHTLAKFCGPRTAGKRRWKDDCTDVTACLRLTTDWLKDLTEESARLSGKVARLKRADSRSKISSESAGESASESASENLDSAAAGAAADAAADAIQSAGTTLNRACLRACFVRACVRVRARAHAPTRSLAG